MTQIHALPGLHTTPCFVDVCCLMFVVISCHLQYVRMYCGVNTCRHLITYNSYSTVCKQQVMIEQGTHATRSNRKLKHRDKAGLVGCALSRRILGVKWFENWTPMTTLAIYKDLNLRELQQEALNWNEITHIHNDYMIFHDMIAYCYQKTIALYLAPNCRFCLSFLGLWQELIARPKASNLSAALFASRLMLRGQTVKQTQ